MLEIDQKLYKRNINFVILYFIYSYLFIKAYYGDIIFSFLKTC